MRFGYCERLSGDFWGEPINAVTNGAFLIAAALALSSWRRGDKAVAALIALVFAIGIGSFLFHTMPQRWTLLADVVPIQLFAFGYFALALRRFLAWSPIAVLLGTLAFLGFAFGLQAGLAPLLPAGMRGSAGYAAFLLALIGMALACARRHPAVAGLLALAAAAFALSLTLRSLDPVLCDAVPFGLHWGWHLLNALVLWLLLRAANRAAFVAPRNPGIGSSGRGSGPSR